MIGWDVTIGKCDFCELEKILIHKICKKCADQVSGLFRRKVMKKYTEKNQNDLLLNM